MHMETNSQLITGGGFSIGFYFTFLRIDIFLSSYFQLVRDKLVSILISEADAKSGVSEVNAILVDFYLWDTRRQLADKMEHIPYHRCRGIYY